MILAVLVAVGFVLYIAEIRYKRRNSTVLESEKSDDSLVLEVDTEDVVANGAAGNQAENGICCGQHLVCEKDSLSPVDAEIEYYDDEELDRFRGRSAEEYSEDEVEEIRDVLMTLREEDVAGWARSITKREIELPTVIRDELLLLVRAQRGIES